MIDTSALPLVMAAQVSASSIHSGSSRAVRSPMST